MIYEQDMYMSNLYSWSAGLVVGMFLANFFMKSIVSAVSSVIPQNITHEQPMPKKFHRGIYTEPPTWKTQEDEDTYDPPLYNLFGTRKSNFDRQRSTPEFMESRGQI